MFGNWKGGTTGEGKVQGPMKRRGNSQWAYGNCRIHTSWEKEKRTGPKYQDQNLEINKEEIHEQKDKLDYGSSE